MAFPDGKRPLVSGNVERNHCINHTELMMRVALWMDSLHALPSTEQVMERFDTHRSTAIRWRNSYCDARGIARIERNGFRDSSTPAATGTTATRETI